MFVVHCPPSSHLLFIHAGGTCTISADPPWFVVSNEMHHVYSTLKVSVSRNILVVATRRTIVGKAQPVPIPEMHVQQTLVCSIEAYASLCQCQ